MRRLALLTILTIGCGGGGGDGMLTGDAGGGTADTATSAGPITLQSLMGAVDGDQGFYVDFIIDNKQATTTPIARVDKITVSWPGDGGDAIGLPACAETPWIDAGEQTSFIRVSVSNSGNATYVGWRCGDHPGSAVNMPSRVIALGNEHVTVQIDGITSDSKPFTATATTRLAP
jgi:hypothetical protein